MADIQVINGNMAAAIGAALCRPDIIAAYPITPQTPIVEYLADFVTGGKLDSSVSEVESELSRHERCHRRVRPAPACHRQRLPGPVPDV